MFEISGAQVLRSSFKRSLVAVNLVVFFVLLGLGYLFNDYASETIGNFLTFSKSKDFDRVSEQTREYLTAGDFFSLENFYLELSDQKEFIYIQFSNADSGKKICSSNITNCTPPNFNFNTLQFNRTIYFDDSQTSPIGAVTAVIDADLLAPIKFKLLLSLLFGWVLLTIVLNTIFVIYNQKLKSLLASKTGLLENILNGQNVNVPKSDSMEEEYINKYLKSALKTISFYKQQEKESAKLKAYAEISRQVSHDIKSPMLALSHILKHVQFDNLEEENLLKSAIQRIQNISGDLVQKIKDEDHVHIYTSLVLKDIIEEKKFEYIERKVKFNTQFGDKNDLFLYGNLTELKRAISNIINNGIEASGDYPIIKLVLSSTVSGLTISITDNGSGIPPELIEKVLEKGFSSGKQGGSGLGLFHANKVAKSFGGHLEIKSEKKQGTTIALVLPTKVKPKFYIDNLSVKSFSKIFIFDDDNSIFNLWESHLAERRPAHHVDYHNYYSTPVDPEALYIVDYYLSGVSYTGMEIAKYLKSKNLNVVLSTSTYDLALVQNFCIEQNIPLLPKQVITEII